MYLSNELSKVLGLESCLFVRGSCVQFLRISPGCRTETGFPKSTSSNHSVPLWKCCSSIAACSGLTNAWSPFSQKTTKISIESVSKTLFIGQYETLYSDMKSFLFVFQLFVCFFEFSVYKPVCLQTCTRLYCFVVSLVSYDVEVVKWVWICYHFMQHVVQNVI